MEYTYWRHWSLEGHPLRYGPSLIAHSSSTLICRPSWQHMTSMMISACPYEHPNPQYLSLCKGMHWYMGFLMGFLCGCCSYSENLNQNKNASQVPWSRLTWITGDLLLETIMCAVSNMEPVYLVKLGAPGVTITARWAGSLEVVRHHVILLEEGRQDLL